MRTEFTRVRRLRWTLQVVAGIAASFQPLLGSGCSTQGTHQPKRNGGSEPPGANGSPATLEDGKSVSGETRRRYLAKFKSSYEPMVVEAFEEVRSWLPEKYKAKAAMLRLQIDVDNETPYSFFAAGPKGLDAGLVTVSIGGLISVQDLGIAYFLAGKIIGDTSWFMAYCLYLRHELVHGEAMNSLAVSGVEFSEFAETTQVAILGFERQCLGFILAHEVGHVMLAHEPSRLDGESKEGYLTRLRNQEEAADQFAIDLMLVHKELPVGPAQLLFAWVLVKDQAKYASDGSSHPADHKRAIVLCEYVLRNIDKYDLLGVDRALVKESFETLLQFCAGVDVNPDEVLQDMEKVGASIKPENLRRERWK